MNCSSFGKSKLNKGKGIQELCCLFFVYLNLELGFNEILDALSSTEHQNLLIQWHVFYRLEEEDIFYQQSTDKQDDDDDAFDDVDSLLSSFVQALLKHPDMHSVSG